jgi:hypothetical protein
VTITGRYDGVLTSEAGKVAIMDRAVQRGVGNAQTTFRTAAKAAMTAHGAQTLADLASYEIEIIPSLKNRVDVLSAADLTQPPAAPATPSPAPSNAPLPATP